MPTNRLNKNLTKSLSAETKQPDNWRQFTHRIVLLVTGLSPQVLTETLYALLVHHQFNPTRICVITTLHGKNRMIDDLFHPINGVWPLFVEQYVPSDSLLFSPADIHVLQTQDGHDLEDIRSPQDNQAAADGITAMVQALTSDPTTMIYASIAGGRKSMGFLLGYALSLYARPQDCLSHVLVNLPFEGQKNFYFPPRIPETITLSDGRQISTDKAEIMLAEIPFVRMRHLLPAALLQPGNSYSAVVDAMQSQLSAQQSLTLRLALASGQVNYGGVAGILPTAECVFLAWMMVLRMRGVWICPNRNGLSSYLQFIAGLQDMSLCNSANFERSIRSMQHAEHDFGKYFHERKSRIKRWLSQKIAHGDMVQLFEQRGKRPFTEYRLRLDEQALDLPHEGNTQLQCFLQTMIGQTAGR